MADPVVRRLLPADAANTPVLALHTEAQVWGAGRMDGRVRKLDVSMTETRVFDTLAA